VNIAVFVGPTLPVENARQELDALYLPPATQGDVYLVTETQPEAIAIIDGQFDQVPAVWHKEILWAMSRGIYVYGAASMGALRAAELSSFGMEGVGAIFEAYRNGTLEDDDEVAVAHLPAGSNFQPTSEAMVNIRCTLAEAERQEVIGPRTRGLLESVAKRLFFPERSYPAILEMAQRQGDCDRAELEVFAHWWPRGSVDQKRADAIALLRLLGERHAGGSAPIQVSYTFQYTIYWQHLVETAGAAGAAHDGQPLTAQAIMDEVWLDPDLCVTAHREALIRHLVLEPSYFLPELDAAEVRQAEAEFRRSHSIRDDGGLEAWRRENHLAEREYTLLMREQALLRRQSPQLGDYRRRLLEQLRLSGHYATLAARARQKQAILTAHGLADRGEADEELEAEVLMNWYTTYPVSNPHYHAFLELARANWRDFIRALVRQHYYESVASAPSP
jgi:hypothetical protein